MPRHHVNNSPTSTRALSSSLLVATLALGLLTMFGCERMVERQEQPSAIALQSGMGVLEAEGALGCQGQREVAGMRTNMMVESNSEWNVEWRIGCVYELENTKVVAVYTAWGSNDADKAPPTSAYRLLEWSAESNPERSQIALWSSDA